MSRRTVLTSATLTCPCGTIKKAVLDPSDDIQHLCDCGHPFAVTIAGHRRENIFPYVTMHLGGTPTTVESLHHLRRLEREHGTVNVAFSQDRTNWHDPMSGDIPTARRRH